MEIRLLKYFLAVAKYENMTKAAEALHVTQPTLSRQIADLEQELGAPLFNRGKRRTTLTEAGYYLKARAEEILHIVDETESQFAQEEGVIAGDIYIGCGETKAMGDVIHALTPLHEKYEQLHFHLVSGNGPQIKEQLERGLIEFGVVCQPVPPKDYAYLELPYADRWGLVMRDDNPLAQKDAVEFSDLKKEPLIISGQALEDREFDHWLHGGAETLHIAGTYTLAYNAGFLVQEGWGSALAFDHLFDAGSPTWPHLCFRPLKPELRLKNFFIWENQHVFSRAGNVVLEQMRKTFQHE